MRKLLQYPRQPADPARVGRGERLQALDLLVEELDDFTGLQIHHVIVMIALFELVEREEHA